MLRPSRALGSRPAARPEPRRSLALAFPPPSRPPSRIATLGSLIALPFVLSLAAPREAAAQAPLFETEHAMFPADTDSGAGAALGDVDGDGDLDVFIGSWGGSGERLLSNDGLARFSVDPAALPMAPATTWEAAFGDVDGDLDLDLLLGSNIGLAPNRLFLNDGTGIFSDGAQNLPPQTVPDTQDVGVADLDGDQDLDILWVQDSGPPWLWLNDGTGVFSDATANMPPTPGIPNAVAIGDADGDLDPDLALGIAFGTALLFVNDGAAGFTDRAGAFPANQDLVTSVAFGDVDGDADLDVYAGVDAFYGTQDHLYRNQGTGWFQDVSWKLPPDKDDTGDVALGDVDGDQDLDVLTANGSYAAGSEQLYLNDGTGTFARAPGTLPEIDDSTLDVAAGDLDGDQDLDAVFVNYNDQQDRLWLGDGAGNFTDADAPLPPAVGTTSAVAAGDLDGDGDRDLMVGTWYGLNQSSVPDQLFLNDGSGAFTDATKNLPYDTDPTRAIALGDVDGDGDLDAWIGIDSLTLGSGQDHLLRNDGAAVFTNATAWIPQLPDPTMAVVLGDVDGDGDLDALLGNLGPYGSGWPARLALNQGTGVFVQAPNNLPDHAVSCDDLAMGDVDGDGDLDAWFATQGQDLLYVNDGTGIFTIGTGQIPPQSSSTGAVSLGDVDGDLDLDAWTVQIGSSVLYRNDGGGLFQASPASIPPTLTSDSDVDLADVDGDGDLDAYLVGGQLWYPKPNQLARNDGTGTFADASSRVPQDLEPASALTLADLDGDGDPDAVFGCTNQQDRVHRNLSRQLSWRHLPRLGKPLLLDLDGPPASPYVLLLSPAAGATGTPYGTLWLSSAGLLVAATGTLDGQGRATFTLPLVPSQPGLAGLSIYWQAFVGLPVGLTNLEITTLTAF